MIEKDHILGYLETQLATIEGVQFVSRNAWKDVTGKAGECPAVFLMDLGDEPLDESAMTGNPSIKKLMHVGILSIVKGTTEAAAPEELLEFQKLMKQAIYANGRKVGTTYKGTMFEVRTSPVYFHKSGNKIVFQRIDYQILYTEDINRLFE